MSRALFFCIFTILTIPCFSQQGLKTLRFELKKEVGNYSGILQYSESTDFSDDFDRTYDAYAFSSSTVFSMVFTGIEANFVSLAVAPSEVVERFPIKIVTNETRTFELSVLDIVGFGAEENIYLIDELNNLEILLVEETKTDLSISIGQGEDRFFLEVRPKTCFGGSTFSALSGVFSDGSGSANYSNNLSCDWLIETPQFTKIVFTSTLIDIASDDVLKVYEGSENTSTLLKSFTGLVASNTFKTSTNQAYFEFRTNEIATENGWSFDYSTETIDGIIIEDQTFSVDENTPDETLVGTIQFLFSTNQHTLSIFSGNEKQGFRIENSGKIFVNRSEILDFEENESFDLVVRGQIGNAIDEATMSISIIDINEKPVLIDGSFSVLENTEKNTAIGQIVATDPEGKVLSYQLVDDYFNVSNEGQLIVLDTSILDFESNQQIALELTISDGLLETVAPITIEVQNINEPPEIGDGEFTVLENTTAQSIIGNINITDPEEDEIALSIEEQYSGYFEFDRSGNLMLIDNSLLNYELNTLLSIGYQASDAQFTINESLKINIQNVNEYPSLETKTLSLNENEKKGTLIGELITNDPEQDPIQITIISSEFSEIFKIEGSLVFILDSAKLDFERTNEFNVPISLNDGTLTTNDEVLISLLDINEPPNGLLQSFSVTENAAIATEIGLVKATDPEQNQIMFSSTDNEFVSLSSEGLLTVKKEGLDYEILQEVELEVTITDGTHSSKFQIHIDILNENEPPQILSDDFSVVENSIKKSVVGLLQADDPEGDNLTWSILSGNEDGIFSIDRNTDQILVENPVLDFENKTGYSLTFQCNDGELSTQKTIVINVTNAANEAPVFSNENFIISYDTIIAGLKIATLNISDPDNDDIDVKVSNAGDLALFSITGHDIFLEDISSLDFRKDTSFVVDVQISDGIVQVERSVSITFIKGLIPVIFDQFIIVSELQSTETFNFQIEVFNPGEGILTYSLYENQHFQIDENQRLIFSASAVIDFELRTADTLLLSVSNEHGASSAKIYIEYTDENEPPTIGNREISLNENSTYTQINLLFFDPEDDIIYAELTSHKDAFKLSANLELNLTQGLDYEGAGDFYLKVSLNDGTNFLNDSIHIILNDINEAPSLQTNAYRLAENPLNNVVIGLIEITDPEKNNIEIEIDLDFVGVRERELFVLDSTFFNYEKEDTIIFNITFSDGENTVVEPIYLYLSDSNEAPSFLTETIEFYENPEEGDTLGLLSSNDPENNRVTFKIEENVYRILLSEEGYLLAGSDTRVNYEDSQGSIVYLTYTDGTHSLRDSIVISVLDKNESPQLTINEIIIKENPTIGLSFQLEVDDPENDKISFEPIELGYLTLDHSGTMNITDSSFFDFEFRKTEVVTVSFTDGEFQMTENVSLIIEDLNESPELLSKEFDVQENIPNGTVVGTLKISDPENDVYTAKILNESWASINGSFAIVVVDSMEFDFEKRASLTFMLEISDGAITTIDEVKILINNVNESPLVSDLSLKVEENATIGLSLGQVVAFDPENDPLTYQIAGSGYFQIEPNSGTISVAKEGIDFESFDEVELELFVSDGILVTTKSVTVIVQDINEPPLVNDYLFRVDYSIEVNSVIGKIEGMDPEGLTANISLLTVDSPFEINDNDELILGKKDGFVSGKTYELSYEATDNALSSMGNISVIVKQDTTKALSFENVKKVIPTIFPNPIIYSFTVRGLNDSTKIAITDLSGKILLDWQDEHEEIIIESWPSGIYLIHFSNGYSSIKILKN